MQDITVASVEAKPFDKKDGSGQGELIIVKDTEGNEFTSFDTALKKMTGAVLSIDTKMNRGKANITKFTVKQAPPPGQEAVTAQTSYNGGDSPEKRKSIEDQTRAYIIADLWKAEKLDRGSDEVQLLLAWIGKMGAPAKKEPPTGKKKAEVKAPQEDASTSGFENVGQLMTAAVKLAKEKGVDFKPSELCEKIGVKLPTEIADLKSAWQDVLTIINEKSDKKLFE